MFERFTDEARKVVVFAQEEARVLGTDFIGTEHILLGLIDAEGSVAALALVQHHVTAELVREELEEIFGHRTAVIANHLPLTPRATSVLKLSLGEARERGEDDVGTGHLLLGLLREGESSSESPPDVGVALQVLGALDVDLDQLRDSTVQLLSTPESRRNEFPARIVKVPTGGAYPDLTSDEALAKLREAPGMVPDWEPDQVSLEASEMLTRNSNPTQKVWCFRWDGFPVT